MDSNVQEGKLPDLPNDLLVAVLHCLPVGQRFTKQQLAQAMMEAAEEHPLFRRFAGSGRVSLGFEEEFPILTDQHYISVSGQDQSGETRFRVNAGLRGEGGERIYHWYKLEEQELIAEVAQQIVAEST